MSKSEHWYQSTPEGIIPCYEVTKAKGEGTRPTTIADARKLGLLPSITTILKVINKPELQSWIVDNAINSALTLPIIDGEPPDAFKERVREDADRQSREAMNWGTRIHDAIEQYLMNGSMPEPEVYDFVWPTIEWLLKNMESQAECEVYVGSQELGFAGRLDLRCQLKLTGWTVCDFKSQRVRKAPAFYPENALQLVAYSRLCRDFGIWPKMLSIVIDSQKPGPPHIKLWDSPEYHWQMFQHAYELWTWQRGFDPRRKEA